MKQYFARDPYHTFKHTFGIVLVACILFVLPLILYLAYIVRSINVGIGDVVVENIPKVLNIPTPTPVQTWLTTSGNTIVNGRGEQIILRGVNMPGVNWSDETKEWYPQAIKYAVKTWGVQVVRTRIIQDSYTQDPAGTLAFLEKLVIGPARKNGAYVILNPWIHDNDPLSDEDTVTMWRDIAAHYKDDPTILYDILSEPHDVSRSALRDANIQLIEAIRSVNPNALIFVTGLAWGREINSYLDDPLPYPNIVYRSNPYNRAGEYESLFGRIAATYPVFIGEFGADAYPPMTRDDVRALLAYADTLGLGWTAWNFHDTGCPCLLTDYQQLTPSLYGQVVFDALAQHASRQGRSLASNFPKELTNIRNGMEAIVYDDGLQNGFIDESWGTHIDLVSNEHVYQGNTSMKVEFTDAGSAIVLHTYNPVNSSPYTKIVFRIHWGGNGPFPMGIRLNDTAVTNEQFTSVGAYMLPLHENWYEVRIPLADLHIDGDVREIIIRNQAGKGIVPFFIDNFSFVSNTP